MTQKINEMVTELKASLNSRETLPMEAADKLLTILDDAPQKALEILVSERVKFCHVPARRRLMDKFGMTAEQVDSL